MDKKSAANKKIKTVNKKPTANIKPKAAGGKTVNIYQEVKTTSRKPAANSVKTKAANKKAANKELKTVNKNMAGASKEEKRAPRRKKAMAVYLAGFVLIAFIFIGQLGVSGLEFGESRTPNLGQAGLERQESENGKNEESNRLEEIIPQLPPEQSLEQAE